MQGTHGEPGFAQIVVGDVDVVERLSLDMVVGKEGGVGSNFRDRPKVGRVRPRSFGRVRHQRRSFESVP